MSTPFLWIKVQPQILVFSEKGNLACCSTKCDWQILLLFYGLGPSSFRFDLHPSVQHQLEYLLKYLYLSSCILQNLQRKDVSKSTEAFKLFFLTQPLYWAQLCSCFSALLVSFQNEAQEHMKLFVRCAVIHHVKFRVKALLCCDLHYILVASG